MQRGLPSSPWMVRSTRQQQSPAAAPAAEAATDTADRCGETFVERTNICMWLFQLLHDVIRAGAAECDEHCRLLFFESMYSVVQLCLAVRGCNMGTHQPMACPFVLGSSSLASAASPAGRDCIRQTARSVHSTCKLWPCRSADRHCSSWRATLATCWPNVFPRQPATQVANRRHRQYT